MRTVLQSFVVFLFVLSSFYVQAQTTGYSGTGANIDVVYHRAQWRINPDSATKAIGGSVTTYFVTKVPNVNAITFDLNSVFTSVTAKYHGTAITVSRPATNIIRLTLPVTLPDEKLDSVTISYNGTPPAASGAAEGFQLATDATSGQNYIYTLSESYEDRDWWPCKADMQDKIDSMDIIVSTPWSTKDTFWVATNGKLIDSTIVGSSRIFTFKNRYPMASYLVCLSVARYNRYYRTANIGGTNVQVAYYLFRGKTSTAYNNITNAMDLVNQALQAFSTKFGDYPYKNEKHGFYEGLGGAGGMEHQTFSAIASNALSDYGTLSHELMHQWFGDKVTFSTWHHLWLAEGFARYSEALSAELVPAFGLNASTIRSGIKTRANNTTNRAYGCHIPDAQMANSNGIWNTPYGSTVYERGAMVVSMLRKLMGDAKFFQACRNYLSDPALAYKSATTDDFKNHCEAVLGYDLDPFFNDFVYGSGYPTYTIRWGNNGKRINIDLRSQTRTSATTTYFRTPVVLRISNGSVDTTVVIYDMNGTTAYAGNGILGVRSGRILAYNLSFVPTTVSFDPDVETLAVGTASADHATLDNVNLVTLAVKIVSFKSNQTENGNLLSLVVAPTQDIVTLTLERSIDGIYFSAIGDMQKGIETSGGINFSFLDSKILKSQTYYYRVKVIDDKGLITYSKIIRVSRQDEGADFEVTPNPASSYLVVNLPIDWRNKQFHYTIYNGNGMVVKREKIVAGSNIKIVLGSVPSGNYIIELNDSSKKLSKGFTVIH